jgi:hypothetical protein
VKHAGSTANSPVTSGSGSGAGSQIIADGALSCFVMKRADFERLLGPYEELWRYEALRKVSYSQGHRQRLAAPVWAQSRSRVAGTALCAAAVTAAAKAVCLTLTAWGCQRCVRGGLWTIKWF